MDANAMFSPVDQIHKIEVEHKSWSEIYVVGQKLSAKFGAQGDTQQKSEWGSVSRIVRDQSGLGISYKVYAVGNNSDLEQVVKVFDNMPVSATYARVPGL